MKTELAKIIDAELNSYTYPNESNSDFIKRVCKIYLTFIQQQKRYTAQALLEGVVEEIEFEAIEIFRVKTYGHYNLASYRRSRNQLRQCN